MIQKLDKYGKTSIDSGKVIVINKYGVIKQPSSGGGGTPSGPAGGDLSGTYPNPSVVWNNGLSTYNSLYYPLTLNPSGYLTSADAAATYYPLTNPSGYITSSALSPYLTTATAAITYQPIGSYLTTISGLNISLLTNDSGYITSSGLSGYVPNTRTLSINGTSYDLTSNRSWTVGDISSSGSYSDPSWIASLAYSKLTGSPTIPSVGTWGALNYPSWSSGTPFVKMTAVGTFTLDNNTYLTGAIVSLNSLTGATQSFTNDTNVTIVSSGTTHTITWAGTLADARIASSATWSAKQTATSAAILATLGWYNYKNTTPSSAVTGTVSETQVLQLLIPANTFSANDILKIQGVQIGKTGTAGSCILKVKLSTSATLPSGTTGQIGLNTFNATTLFGGFRRDFAINGGNITGFPFTANQTDSNNASTNAMGSQAFNYAVNNYLYVSLTNGSAADSSILYSIQISNF